MISSLVAIKHSPGKGRGVFAQKNIKPGTTVEVSPVIVMENHDRLLLDQTLLHDYIFEWGAQKEQCAMALGYIAVYNHSYLSNCEYYMDFENETIEIKAVRAVKSGEELTINYNGDWNDEKKIWFEAKE